MQPIKTSHGIAILGTCFLITLLFINWAGRQIDSYVLSVPISPSSQMAAISGSGSGLVAHYTFDDGTASDSSGNGNNGTVNGATAVVGKVGSGAMSFDGVDDIIEVTQSSSINDPLALTVSVWAKQSTLKTNGYYISKADNSSGGHGWSFGSGNVANSSLSFVVHGFTTTDLSSISASGVITTNSWNHYVVTWDGSNTAANVRMYKNGVEVSYATQTNGGSATPQSDSARNIKFARESGTGSTFFNVNMDDVRVYNRALTQAEIIELYALGSGGEMTSPSPAEDTQAPSTPANLSATSISSSQINLSWTASIDNIGVTGYRIYRNGSQLTTTANTSYSDTGLTPNTTYTYTVQAYDAANNPSSQSLQVQAITQASTTVPPPGSSPTGIGNWYVDSDVAVSGDGRSWAGAWKRFADIDWVNIQPGHTIWVSGGTYTEEVRVQRSGTAANPIRLKASQEAGHNNKVIINGSLGAYGYNYIIFDGAKSDTAAKPTTTFEVKTLVPANTNWQVKGFVLNTTGGGDGVTIRWMEIGPNFPQPESGDAGDDKYGFYSNVGYHSRIMEYTWMHGIGDTGIKQGDLTWSGMPPFDSFIVRWSYFADIGNDMIEGQPGMTMHNNFFDRQTRNPGAHADGLAGPMGHTRFYNNILVDIWDQVIYLKIWEGNPNNHGDVYIYGNLIYMDKLASPAKGDGVQTAMSLGWETGRPNVPADNELKNLVVANNTFIARGTMTPGDLRNMFDFVNAYAGSNTVHVRNMVAKNNIFYNSPTSGTGLKGPSTGFEYSETDIQYNNNVVWSSVTAGKKITYRGVTYDNAELFNNATIYNSNTSAQPSFMSVAGKDFRLSSSDTAAKNKGANLLGIAPDIDKDLMGNIRGQDGAWDIGAFEETTAPVLPWAGLVAHWNFNNDDFTTSRTDAHRTIPFMDGSGAGTIADCQSAFALNGTAYNQCPAIATGPDGSRAAQFARVSNTCDIAGDYLGVARNSSINSLTQGTISLWISNASNASADLLYRVLDTLKTRTPHTWVLHRDGDPYYTFTVNDDSGAEIDVFTFPGNNSSANSWNLYTITWDGSAIKGYYNGMLFGERSMSDISSLELSSYLAIGALMHGDPRNTLDGGNCVNQYGGTPGLSYVFPNAGFFLGKLDDVRIYSRALSVSEVAGLASIATAPSTQFILATQKSGTGTGSIVGGGISCGKHCAESFASNSAITLTVTPSIDSVFSGWSGACTGTGICTVAMNSHKSVTAIFTRAYDVVASFAAPSGVITSPFIVSNGTIYQPQQNTSTAPVLSGGKAAYSFTAPEAGEYIVAMKINAPSQNANSLFVNFDAEPTGDTMAWHVTTTGGFEQRFVSWGGSTSGNNPSKIFTLSAGQHTLIIRGREALVNIYSVVILKKGVVATVNSTPTVSAGSDKSVALPQSVSLQGTATDDALPLNSTLSVSWSKVSGPTTGGQAGTVTFANPSSAITTATFSRQGTYVLRLTATDGSLSATDDVTITVTRANPTVSITSPQAGTALTLNTPVPVTVSASPPTGFTLSSVKLYDRNTLISTKTSSPWTFSFTPTTPGIHTLKAIAEDSGGASTDSSPISLTVTSTPPTSDDDQDGVPNSLDLCPKTIPLARAHVDTKGCPTPKADNFSIKPNWNTISSLISAPSLELGILNLGKVTLQRQQGILLVKSTQDSDDRLDFDSHLSFSQNKVTANPTELPLFSEPTTITLYNIDEIQPKILKDGTECSDCTITSYQDNTLIFTVPHFSTYEITEGYINPPNAPEPARTTGGGGGGGGRRLSTTSSATPATPTLCLPGYLFHPATGQRCSTQAQSIPGCLPNYLFSPITGQLCSLPASPRQSSTGATAGFPTANFTRDLALGSRGEDVRNLQIFLNTQGFTVSNQGVGSKGNETDYFGPATHSAVIRFQNYYRDDILTPVGLRSGTGYFGPSTMRKVNVLLVQ